MHPSDKIQSNAKIAAKSMEAARRRDTATRQVLLQAVSQLKAKPCEANLGRTKRLGQRRVEELFPENQTFIVLVGFISLTRRRVAMEYQVLMSDPHLQP